MGLEAEIGAKWPQAKGASECLEPPEARKGNEWMSPMTLSGSVTLLVP